MTTVINLQNNLAQDLFTIAYPTPRVPSITSVGTEAVLTFDTTNVNINTSASVNGATGQITLSSTSTAYQIIAQAEINSNQPVHLKLVRSATGEQVGVAVPIFKPLTVVVQPPTAGDYEIVVYSDTLTNFQYPNQIQNAQITVQDVSGGGGGNPFDQALNTTDSVQFANTTVTNTATISGMSIGLNNGEVSVPGVTVDSDNVLVKMNANGGTNGSLIFSGIGTSNTRRAFAIDRNMRLRWFNGATILTALSSTDGSIDYIAGPNGSMAFSTNGYESLIGLTTNSNTIIQAGSEQSIEFRQFTDDVSPTNTIAVLNTTTSTVYSGFEIQAPGGLGPWTWSFDTNGLTTIPGDLTMPAISNLNTDSIQSLTANAFSLNALTGITAQNYGIQIGATYTPLTSDPALLGGTATGLVVCADAVNWDPAGHSTSTPYLTMYNGTVWSVLG